MDISVVLSIILYLISAIGLGQSVQALEKNYDYPLTTRYVMMSSTILLIPIAELISHCSSAPTARVQLWYAHQPLRTVLCSGVVAALTLGGGLTFIYALDGASVTLVNALTRSKPVIIYALSVPLLSEPVRLPRSPEGA